jgi:hypothetical protein
MTEINIPFTNWARGRIAEKKKFATTRTKRYGDVGDMFVVDGQRFELTEISRLRLSCVAIRHYKDEGCATPIEFIDIWKQIHHLRGWEPYRVVWLHMFRLVEGKNNEMSSV